MYRANDAHLPPHPVQAMLDALPDAAVALDAGTQEIRGANQRAVALLSPAATQAHGDPARKWFDASSLASLVDAAGRAQPGGGAWVDVKIAGRASRVYASSLAIGSDKLILVVVRPPSASRGIASLALVREILAQLPIGVLLAEPGQSDVVLLNAACAEMCGIAIADRHQLIAADRTWQVRDLNGKPLKRDQLPTVRALLRAERSGPDDLILVPADGGAQRIVSTISTPVFDDHGEAIAAVTTLVDVTQRREAERALQAAREQAEVDARRKGAFYAALSREIRGPLTSILGYVELIGDPETPAADRMSWCNTVRRSGDALMALMQDLVDLGQMDAGSFRLSPGPTQLSLVLGEVQSVARTRGQRRGIDVAMRYTTPVPRVVEWDAARLRRALLTMMTFAIDHADHGDVALQVAVIGAGASRKVAFDVSAWCGTVTSDDLTALLDPYTPSKGGSRAWSLAIPVASRLAEMMGGAFDCKADGRRLWMRFTASAPPGAFEDTFSMHAVSIDDRPRSSRPPPRLRGRVLLVEDSEDDRMLVTRMLERSGLRVDAVATAAEAFEAAMDQLDAVLMDVELPGMDGLEATRRLRERGVAVPVVALTAAALAGDRERCLAAGCTAYVSKPIDRPTLLRTLDDLISTTEDRRIMSELPEELQALEPLRSTKEADASMRDALAQFGERAARYVEHIARNIEAGDRAGAERAARSLGGTAGSYGFEPLGRAADRLADACKRAEARPGEVTACLQAVSDLAQRVRATYPGRTPTVPPTSR
jgi:CheY-like chemotaxis protein/signal transduction histidine kinase